MMPAYAYSSCATEPCVASVSSYYQAYRHGRTSWFDSRNLSHDGATAGTTQRRERTSPHALTQWRMLSSRTLRGTPRLSGPPSPTSTTNTGTLKLSNSTTNLA
ncbi:unnamed protein product [Ixodes persulcatus]